MATKIISQIAPNRVNRIGIILRVVVLNKLDAQQLMTCDKLRE